MASHARKLLPIILHLKEPTSRREVQLQWRSLQDIIVSSKRQDRLFLRSQLRNRVTTGANLAQEWQQVGVRASARTVRPRQLGNGLVSRRAAKKPLLSKENVKDRLKFSRKDWTAEYWCKVIFSDETPFRLFGASGQWIVRRRKAECYHEPCVVPTVKHPEIIHVWGCFSTKGVGSLIILPKNIAINKEWYQNVLQERLLPTIHKQFGYNLRIFQHDEAPCHKARVIKKWLEDHCISIFDPWPGNSQDLSSIENLWSVLKRTSRSPQIVINSEN